MRYRAMMFDLDGTLADTLADIAACGNHVLESYGLPPLERSRYRYLAGQGARYLVAEALGPTHQDRVDEGLARFKAYQLVHGLDQTRPYPGIPELLDALTARGIQLAVLSNKPDAATREAIQRVLGKWSFGAVLGHREGSPLKPDPHSALEITGQLGIPSKEWIYVGDTRVDVATGKAAGMFTVGVLWGFRDEAELREAGADAIIFHPLELLKLL